jgi:ubiquinone/menaquinone biosynthesis C-methylase UbiE
MDKPIGTGSRADKIIPIGSGSQTDHYRFAAYFYDALASIYSGFQIPACKIYQIDWIIAGDTALYAGAGGADDAILAARKGASVTIVELSQKMLSKARAKIRKQGLEDKIKLIHDDICNHDANQYDVVVSNFFLNVFEPAAMETVLSHLVKLVKDDGRLLIADFAPLTGNFLTRSLQFFHYGLALMFFHFLTRNPLHGIYDYPTLFSTNGLATETIRDMGLLGFGPKWYRVIVARKPRHESA